MDQSRTITADDARIIRALAMKGWAQHDVASLFGCNQGRVAEVVGGQRHPGSGMADLSSNPVRVRIVELHWEHSIRMADLVKAVTGGAAAFQELEPAND